MGGTPYVPSIAIDAVITALASFLQPFVGASTPIIRAQVNRVPPPVTAFVQLLEMLEMDLETPTFANDGMDQEATITTPTRIDIQVDFYGPASGDQCKAVKAVFRSPYAPDQFPTGIAPLYCSDGHQAQLITGEEQYESRWILTVSLQYNPDVIITQQSATTLKVTTIEDLP